MEPTEKTEPPAVILVVDNDRDTLTVHERVLSSAGFRVVSASRAAEALEYARATRPDAIITDLRLPGPMDGADLIREVRRDAALRDVPIVAVSGGKDIDLAGVPMATLLRKPVSPRALVSHVRAVILSARSA